MAKPPKHGRLDDLTLIVGITPAMQLVLRDSLGTCTYRDLANLSAVEIENALVSNGHKLSSRTIKNLLSHARYLADDHKTAPVTSIHKPTGLCCFAPPVPDVVATFVVEYQRLPGVAGRNAWFMQVHHIESDETTQWTGVNQARLCQWMMERLRDDDTK